MFIQMVMSSVQACKQLVVKTGMTSMTCSTVIVRNAHSKMTRSWWVMVTGIAKSNEEKKNKRSFLNVRRQNG